MALRQVARVIKALETSEGMGARVKRTIGIRSNRDCDPFLMLDEFFVKKPAGFPDHPHKGFATLTFMLDGAFKHKDSVGNEGTIKPYETQYMVAGKGIVHSEMPVEQGVNHGLQLWINLPKSKKLMMPTYWDITQEGMAKGTKDGVTAHVVIGELPGFELKSKAKPPHPFTYIHFEMEEGSTVRVPMDKAHAGFVYIHKGKVSVSGTKGSAGQLLRFEEGDEVGDATTVELTAREACGLIFVSGEPIREPIVQYGPMVMNTQAEIQEAFAQYSRGEFRYKVEVHDV